MKKSEAMVLAKDLLKENQNNKVYSTFYAEFEEYCREYCEDPESEYNLVPDEKWGGVMVSDEAWNDLLPRYEEHWLECAVDEILNPCYA